MTKIKLYHFHNGKGGGVLSVIKNLIFYSSNDSFEHHIIHTINKDDIKKYVAEKIEGTKTEQVFYYSPSWNFYFTCKKLASLISDDSAILLANDWLELGMVSNLGLQNKVLLILHGDYDYYYTLAKTHSAAIDVFISVAASISEKLQSILPGRSGDIKYLRFPVPESICSLSRKYDNSIIFIGRCTEDKGYHKLPAIAKYLQDKHVICKWHIVGDLNDENKFPWHSSIDVKFYGEIPNETVRRLLCNMTYFILPSSAEGMPLSLIESMKAGVIPIVNNLKGGIPELINNGQTGFLSRNNFVEEYIQIFEEVINSPDKQIISNNAILLANKLFDPKLNCEKYEDLFKQVAENKGKLKKAIRIYGSRLDVEWLPNLFVKMVRSHN